MIRALVAATLAFAILHAGALAHAAPAQPEPCLERSASVRPQPTADDLADCVYQRLDARRIRVTVAYTYASPLGAQNIWLTANVVAGGAALKWFGVRPAPITGSRGTATLELIYGFNSPPPAITSDAVEFLMFVGGAQVFFKKTFGLRAEWRL